MRDDRFALDMAAIAAMQLDPTKGAAPDDVAVERIVQSLVKVGVRRSQDAGLDGAATLTALIEATARIALAMPGAGAAHVPEAVGAMLANIIRVRAAGIAPGHLDDPRTHGPMQ